MLKPWTEHMRTALDRCSLTARDKVTSLMLAYYYHLAEHILARSPAARARTQQIIIQNDAHGSSLYTAAAVHLLYFIDLAAAATHTVFSALGG